MILQLNVEEKDSNAIVYYKSETKGKGREVNKTIVKEHFVYSKTSNPIFTESYFYTSTELVEFVNKNINTDNTKTDEEVVDVILYSQDGFNNIRRKVKKSIENDIEKKSITLCILTCGLAICICCCCDKKSKNKLNENNICDTIKQQYPDKVNNNNNNNNTVYTFTAPSTDKDNDDIATKFSS